ncbi:MAG: hypothetical protein ACR2LH_07370 [Thermoleophilaceae bacterium]
MSASDSPDISTATGARRVFLVVPHGFAARYLLRTAILETLLEAGLHVVVLAPNANEEYLRRELSGRGVELEQLRAGDEVDGSRVWKALVYLRRNTLGGGESTTTLRARYRNARRRLETAQPLVARALDLAVRALWRSRALRKLLLRFECRAFAPDVHRDLFERHRPALVVTTSPGWFLADAVVLREARRHGARTAAVVMAWDNPTSKGYRGACVDRVVAWSESMADELVRHHDLPPEIVSVAGVPSFDRYVAPEGLLSREEALHSLGLDPARRLVVFAGRSPSSYAHNVTVAEALARGAAEGAWGEPAQLLVRPHPIHFRADHRTPMDAYGELTGRYPHVSIDVPEVLSERLACDLSPADNLRFASVLRHCDVLVNLFSTTTLEAFLLDRPVVLVSPAAHRALGLNEDAEDSRSFDEDAHVQATVREGAARVAGTLDELIELVGGYLAEPELDSEARASVATAECGPTDGAAGRRTAGLLLELLDEGDAAPVGTQRVHPDDRSVEARA